MIDGITSPARQRVPQGDALLELRIKQSKRIAILRPLALVSSFLKYTSMHLFFGDNLRVPTSPVVEVREVRTAACSIILPVIFRFSINGILGEVFVFETKEAVVQPSLHISSIALSETSWFFTTKKAIFNIIPPLSFAFIIDGTFKNDSMLLMRCSTVKITRITD